MQGQLGKRVRETAVREKREQIRKKCHTWTKKIFFYFLQMAIHNSYVLYKQYTTEAKKLSMLDFHGVLVDALIDFKHDEWEISGEVFPHADDLPSPTMPDMDVDDPGEGTSSGSVRVPPPPPATPATPARRELQFLPPDFPLSDDEDVADDLETTPTGVKKKKPRIIDDNKRLKKNLMHDMVVVEKAKRKRCRVCFKNGKRKDTRTKCRSCDMFLCIDPCYRLYHAKKVYWGKH